MLTKIILRKPSISVLREKNYADFKRVLDLYDRWDVAAKEKDFHNAEHFDWMIRKIYDRNGIKES